MVTFRRAYRCLYRELFLVSPRGSGEDPFPAAVTIIAAADTEGANWRGFTPSRAHSVGSIRDGGRMYFSSHRESARVESVPRALFPIVLSRKFGHKSERASERASGRAESVETRAVPRTKLSRASTSHGESWLLHRVGQPAAHCCSPSSSGLIRQLRLN